MKKLPWCPAICSLCLLLPGRASSGMRTHIPLAGRLLLGQLDLQWTWLTSAVCWPSRLALVSFRFRSLSSPPTVASFQPCWVCRGRYHCTSMETDCGPRKGEEGWLSGLSLLDATLSVTAALPSLCMGVRDFSGAGCLAHTVGGSVTWTVDLERGETDVWEILSQGAEFYLSHSLTFFL